MLRLVQRIGLLILLLTLLVANVGEHVLAASTTSAQNSNRITIQVPTIQPRATLVPIKSVTTIPNSSLNRVNWQTPQVTLLAKDFYLMANGKKYLANNGTVTIHSDPGNPNYTTLELIWHENETEMRLFMYFHANEDKWWVSEMRTYDGRHPGDWIFYYGPFPTTPRGQVFLGDVHLTNHPGLDGENSVNFTRMYLSVFKDSTGIKPAPLPSATLVPMPPYPKPSPNPSVVPEPGTNHPPVINTKWLPLGIVFRNYKAVVKGYDGDPEDLLEMKIEGLPLGLSQGPCGSRAELVDKAIYECAILGVPERAGIFPIKVLLQDNHGATDTQHLFLFVLKYPLPFIIH